MSLFHKRLIAVPLLLLHAAAALVGDGLHAVLHCEHHRCEHHHVAHTCCAAELAATTKHHGCSHSHAIVQPQSQPVETSSELSSAHYCVVCDWLAQLSHAVEFAGTAPTIERNDFCQFAAAADVPVARRVAQPARGPPASVMREV